MPITIVTWIMTLGLIATYILLNIYQNKKANKSDRRLEVDRRYFSYTCHIPERRSGLDRRLIYKG